MVVERFKAGDPVPVYRRFAEAGRLAPEGLHYRGSWVAADLRRCFQLMETDQPGLLEEWTRHWADLVDFEIVPVTTSAEAAQAVARLGQ